MKKASQIIGLLSLVFSQHIEAQTNLPVQVVTKKEKGIEIIQKDSLFSMQFQFRMQNRAGYMSESEKDLTPKDFEFRVRRLRMRLRGFVINPKFGYHVQLSFSRGDMDWESTNDSEINTSVNVVRDAVVSYDASKSLKFIFGQTKLPGNRQRVVSSGNLQFADRSIVNSTFTIDRDFGFFANYDKNYFAIKTALTSGEGRNSTKSNKGLNYTGRVEILPFGKFSSGNDECEGDLAREKTPKLAICGTYNYNDDAVRSGGTLGSDLYNSVDMQNLHLDLLFKYRGFAFYQEYLNRQVENPVTENLDNGSIVSIYTGFGMLTQVSYLFKNNIEIAGRFAMIQPRSDMYNNAIYSSLNIKKQEHIQLGLTKYLYGHRLKLQGNLLYHITSDLKNSTNKKQLGVIFQVEMGI
ncbi:MAG: porin [Crocinitomicaceae bacterium]